MSLDQQSAGCMHAIAVSPLARFVDAVDGLAFAAAAQSFQKVLEAAAFTRYNRLYDRLHEPVSPAGKCVYVQDAAGCMYNRLYNWLRRVYNHFVQSVASTKLSFVAAGQSFHKDPESLFWTRLSRRLVVPEGL